MPNFIFLTRPNLQILGKTHTVVFPISGFLINGYIDMKLGVAKLNKRRKKCQKGLTLTSCRQFVMSLSFFKIMVNLERHGSWIPDTYSVKLIFSLIKTFCGTRNESRTKKSLTQLSRYCFEYRCCFYQKKTNFLVKKNVDIS